MNCSKKIFFFIVLLLCCNQIYAQRKAARIQIADLKKGYLLIRLSTRERTVEDLQKMGKTRAADEIRKEQETKNKKIVESFKQNFNFCEYRFFYSQYSTDILNGNFKFLIFDKDLKPDNEFNLSGKNFYVAEFGLLEADTMKISKESRIDYNKDFSAEEVPVYYSNTPNKIYALVVKDNHFYQLKYPFPYFVPGRNIDKAVRKLDSKLKNYYAKYYN